MTMSQVSDTHAERPFSEPVRAVIKALDNLKYGIIQITVHDGKLMQMDVTEKMRFNASSAT
jgi:hypothetical protein